ncbi:MAG: hypothetical protein EOS42_06075, partial [Mesorhizobium sp.]
NTEENILFNAASAYMDVIRDRQVAVLTEQNLQFLTEQARAALNRMFSSVLRRLSTEAFTCDSAAATLFLV